MKALTNLRVLKLTVHSGYMAMYDSILDEGDAELQYLELRMHKEARTVADRIFDGLAQSCPQLVAVAMDAADAVPFMTPAAFIRAKQVDLYGKVSYVATPVSLSDIKHHEPCSSILQGEALVMY